MASIINVNEIGPAAGFSAVTVNSDLTVNTLKSKGTGFNDVVSFQNASGTENGTLCRAWVNFNGSGTIAILASFNTSSITDNANGDYTMNFTTAMIDENFSAVMTSSPKVGTNGQYNMIVAPFTSTTNTAGTRTRSASSIRMSSRQTNIDAEDVNVAIFR